MSVWKAGRKLFEEGEVKPYWKGKSGLHFKVCGYIVDVGKWNKLTCGCYFGVTHGVNGSLCKHKVAVILWLVENEECDFFSEESPRASRSTEGFGHELTTSQKKLIKDMMPCELHGKDCDGKKEIHRVKRQGSYELRNIMVVCNKAHKQIHGKEPKTYHK